MKPPSAVNKKKEDCARIAGNVDSMIKKYRSIEVSEPTLHVVRVYFEESFFRQKTQATTTKIFSLDYGAGTTTKSRTYEST